MQIIEPAIKFVPKKRLFRYLSLSPQWLILTKMPALGNRIFQFIINERIIEYPFVYSNINLQPGGQVLDVGPGASKLPVELASLGYKVWIIDLNEYPYPVNHPNFHPVQGDMRKTSLSHDFFDRVTAISSIEHVGLEGEDNFDGDKKAIREIKRVLKPGGKVLLTVPFGKRLIHYYKGIARHRVYDLEQLKELLSGLDIEKMEWAVAKNGLWSPAPLEEVKGVDHADVRDWHSSKAVALIVAKKPQACAPLPRYE